MKHNKDPKMVIVEVVHLIWVTMHINEHIGKIIQILQLL